MDKHTESLLQEFVQNNPSGVIVIYGPTGSGKTALSIEVAHLLEGSEIISVDARQIYRGLDIGTGKITHKEKQGIPHHMLDIIDVTESFSVVEYQNIVEQLAIWKKMQENVNTGENNEKKYFPILCGGTGLYIDSLIYEREYMGQKPNPIQRRELEEYRIQYGNQALWEKLHAIDPTYAEMLHVNNYTYIIRGIEVFEETGRSKLEAQHGQKLKYPTLFLTPYVDTPENRKNLYTKIDKRVGQMFDDGLIDEIQTILAGYQNHILHNYDNNNGRNSEKCYNDTNISAGSISTREIYQLCPGLATIGYREVIEHLYGEYSLSECISLVQQHNRNYAKRQITWNKKYESTR